MMQSVANRLARKVCGELRLKDDQIMERNSLYSSVCIYTNTAVCMSGVQLACAEDSSSARCVGQGWSMQHCSCWLCVCISIKRQHVWKGLKTDVSISEQPYYLVTETPKSLLISC